MISFELMNQIIIKHTFASLRGLDTNSIDALVVCLSIGLMVIVFLKC